MFRLSPIARELARAGARREESPRSRDRHCPGTRIAEAVAAMAQNVVPAVPDSLGLDVQRSFLNFLQTFQAGDEESIPDYIQAVEEMKDQDRTTLYVDFNHLLE